MQKKEVAFNSILRRQDSHLKFVSNIASKSSIVTSQLHRENLELRLETKAALEERDIMHAQSLSEAKKETSAVIQEKNRSIQELKSDVKEMEKLAMDVAVEHYEITQVRDESEKKMSALKTVAANRLQKIKDSNARVDDLKDVLEDTKEEMAEKLYRAESEIDALKEHVLLLTEENEALQERTLKLQYHEVKKRGKVKTWDHIVTQLVVEMLAHRTPPSCVAPNILSVAKLLMPNATIIHELPSDRFVRYCRSVLLLMTKTLAAFEIARAQLYQQLFTDGTGRRQTEMQNVVIGILTDGGYRRVSLDGCVIAEEKTAEAVTASILVAFRESGKLLEKWRLVTSEMYPDRSDLLDQIPRAEELTLAKLAKEGFTMTDTCSTAQKIQRLIGQAIDDIAKKEGLSADEINVRQSHCWQHLRNVWFGGVSKVLNASLLNRLSDCLESLPSILRIDMNVEDLYRCVEKEFGQTANYNKGQGNRFGYWLHKYHPGAYLFPIARACGGARQDLCVEGAPAILMNLPYYLQFLKWLMSTCGSKGDGILATKLHIMLTSVEVIALLRLLSILHISICLPTRWLAGKTQDLAEYDFGYYEMGKALDLMETSFESIVDDPKLILDEEFMMGIFSDISDKVDPFQEYLLYMFEEKLSPTISKGSSIDDKVLPYDEVRCAIFYPHRTDIVQTEELCY